MLERLDLGKKMGRDAYREEMEKQRVKLGELQRRCKDLEIPVMIAFEGYGASGKGLQISKLIQALDPRGFQVYAVKSETEEEKMHPFLWRFWTKLPEKGRIAIYDTSWYRRVLIDRFDKKIKKSQLSDAYESIRSFESQLTEDGMVMIKIFLAIDKKEQKKRFEKLLASKDTAWRVSKGDRKRNKEFAKYEAMNDEMLSRTDSGNAPWYIVEAVDRRFATVKIYSIVTERLEKQIEKEEIKRRSRGEKGREETKSESGSSFEMEQTDAVLAGADLSLSLTKEEYEKRRKYLQKKIRQLHGELYRRRIPVVLAFEGWDAGGKGGAIKRLTAKMDPRGYVVYPTASPNAVERQYHYLWRFWRSMPKAGHIAVFDRTWYGRVMVERVEGFCTETEWRRAYKEINDMERDLVREGTLILKFWMQIDKEEQKKRFQERQDDPKKRWKITEEDWRNREKWEQYEGAVNEMLIRTSTAEAPWTVVEGNCKYYARIKVMETVVKAIEEQLQIRSEKE